MPNVLLVPPAAEPLSLDEAKAWLRLDTNDEDALVSALIVAARNIVEATTRRALITQTWRIVLDRWPSDGAGEGDPLAATSVVRLALAPLASVQAMRVLDNAGTARAIDASTWKLVDAPDDAKLIFATQPPAPGQIRAGIEIDVVAGYGDAADDVPQALRQAMLLMIARWYENRGDEATTQSLVAPAASLLEPYCRPRLA
jgi:uncharacterized phiE125 gp8 family phage protein